LDADFRGRKSENPQQEAACGHCHGIRLAKLIISKPGRFKPIISKSGTFKRAASKSGTLSSSVSKSGRAKLEKPIAVPGRNSVSLVAAETVRFPEEWVLGIFRHRPISA
jgi:hypothetical protein